MRAWIKSWWARVTAPPAAASPATKPAMKVAQAALAGAGPATKVKELGPGPFTLPKPPPGVIPDGRKMAVDEAIGGTYQYALSDAYEEGLVFMGYPALSSLAQRAEYRRPAEIIAQEMTRKWIKITATGTEDEAQQQDPGADALPGAEPAMAPGMPGAPQVPPVPPVPEVPEADDKAEKIKAIEAELKRLNAKEVFKRAIELDGFFGRAQIYIDLGELEEEEMKLPLSTSAVKIERGALKTLRIVEPIWTYPGEYNSTNPLKDYFFRPKTWYVLGKEIHESRLMTIIARQVPDMLKPAYAFGGLSLSQMCKPYVDNWLNTRQSVSDLLQAFTVWVLKTDMSSILSGGNGADLFTRADLFNRLRNNRGLMLVDKDGEEFQNITTSLAGLDHLQAQAQEHQATPTGIPLVKLFGITPSGLNASSDGEIRTFYDGIEAQQESLLRPHLERLINIVQLHLFGEIDPEISFAFVPLMSMDEKQQAEIRKTEADTAGVLIDKGVIDPIEARKVLANAEDSPYASLDLTHVPDPPQQEQGGGMDPFGNPMDPGAPAEPQEPGQPPAPPQTFAAPGATQ